MFTIPGGLRQEVKPYDIRTAVILPGGVDAELPGSITESDVASGVCQSYESYAASLGSFARTVAFAISQPSDVGITKIAFRPTHQELCAWPIQA